MLPSSQRLTRRQITDFLKNTDISVVFNRLGTLKYQKNLLNIGFSVVTGSKNQKKAILRNKVRRQIYTIFRKYSKTTPFLGVLYVSKQVYDMTYIDIERYFYALLEQIEKNS